jgi:O-antigen ligase/tetratricopeptide (TPR) repeat protein
MSLKNSQANSKKTEPNSGYIYWGSIFFLLAYWSVGFVPRFSAVDEIGAQWIYLNGLNLASLVWMFTARPFFLTRWGMLTRIPLFWVFVALMFWSIFSFVYAINPVETWVNAVRVVAIIVALGQVFALLGAVPRFAVFLSWAMLVALTIEMYMVLKPLLGLIEDGAAVSRSNALRGTTGNINIAALSMVIKLPFVLYLMHTIQSWWRIIVLNLIVTLVFFCLIMIGSRASFVALFVNTLIYLAGLFFWNSRSPKKGYLFPCLFFLICFLIAFGLSKSVLEKNNEIDFVERVASTTKVVQDGSIAARLRFYKHGIDHMIENPIFGAGLGNWKLQSIHYEKENISGYVVPYHMHNDFLELGSELGFIGLGLYLLIILLGLWYLWQITTSSLPIESRFWIWFLVLGLATYYVDATFNFPWARPIMQMTWLSLFAVIMHQGTQISSVRLWRPSRILSFSWPILAIAISIPSLWITMLTYQSLVGQNLLLGEYNKGKILSTPEKIIDLVPEIPDITVTTLPIVSLKGRYFMEAKRYDEAEKMFKSGVAKNPFLGFSENLLTQLYFKQDKYDSALKYSKIAYEKLPIPMHFSNYLNSLVYFKDSIEILRIFLKDSVKRDEGSWRNFLVAANNVMSPGRADIVAIADSARSRYPENKDLKSIYKLAVFGKNRIDLAFKAGKEGNDFFAKGQFSDAVTMMKKASELDPMDYSYVENIGAAYYSMGEWEKSLKYLDQVIYEFKPGTGKSEFIKALSLINLGKREEACELLKNSISMGYKEAEKLSDSWCLSK